MFPTTEMHELTLVETLAGLCSYSHAPALRNQSISSDSKLIDQIALDNMAGELTQGAIQGYAPHLSGFTMSPIAQSTIRGGYDEYNKGVAKLKFRVGKENFKTEYLHVFGFVTNNDIEDGISQSAIFVPVCSWRESQTIKNGVDSRGRPVITSSLSRRNDYIFNDGTLDQHSGWTTIRPADVLNGISNNLDNKKLLDRITEDHDIDRNDINVGESTSSLALTSVISKRGNINPTNYSGEILSTITKTNNDISGSRLKNVYTGNEHSVGDVDEGDYYQSTASSAYGRETKSYDDPFLSIIMEGQSLAGYRGTSFGDLLYHFPNFIDTIPREGFITLDRGRQGVEDFREITRLFGSSGIAETIAYEVVFNILDIMTLNGLSIFHCIGSNCERQDPGYVRRSSDDRMSNIEIVPTHYIPMADGDIEVHQRADYACEDITNQIMTKLNGMGYHVATPVKFEIESELFAMTTIKIALPTDENPNPYFISYSFPTYAFSRFSPILTNMDGHNRMCDGIYKNLSSYLKDGFR